MGHTLEFLFKPRSIAVVGASRSPRKIGHTILRNLIAYGFRGRLYPINPRADEILGLRAYPSILDVPGEVDLAVIAVPAEKVPSVLEECGRKGVKVAAVISSGFGEKGRVEAEEELARIARRYGMRLLGPNIFGFAYAPSRINATFGPSELREGGIGFITQSGALGIALMGWTVREEIGLSALVNVGNMVDIDVVEVAEYLAEDEHTRSIAVYLEGLRPSRGGEFVRAMRRVSCRKPVVILKAGRGRWGATAARHHTGSEAGSWPIYMAAFRQAGLIPAPSLVELFDWARILADQPPPGRGGVLIVTNGGGVGVLASDAAEAEGLELVKPAGRLREELERATPWFGAVENPVDLTGGAREEDYAAVIDIALSSPEVGGVVVLYAETGVTDPVSLAETIVKVVEEHEHSKPVTVGIVGGWRALEAIRILNSAGVSAYPTPERAVASMARLYQYHHSIRRHCNP